MPPLNDLPDFDAATPGNNADIASANIAEGCPPGGINNALRALCSIVTRAVGNQGANIASASTTNIAAAGTSLYAHVTGTTAITSFGTVAAGTLRIVEFDGVLILTHNGTSLKLPGSANTFYERAIGEHLHIGLAALDLLRMRRSTLHSRKLRSFDEPPFR